MRPNTKGKRFLALVLVAILMLSVCPVTASAEDNLTCTKNADCEADTHFTDCPKYVAAEECTGDDDCEAETHVEGCPKLVTEKGCTGDNDCEAETHVEGCPKLVTVKECTGDDDCEAETHTEDCPKYVAEKDTEATEPEEVPEAVKAFLDAVAAIVLPEEINEETGPVLNEQIGAAQEAYGALSEEELAREDVQAAAVKMQEAMNFLTGGLRTLETTYVAKIGENTYETLDEAIEAASNGDTITLLADAVATKTFYKSLTFTGGHTVSVDAYGWRYNGNLIIDGANFNINTDESSPVANNGEALKWFTMVLGGSITAKNGANVTFTFDSTSGTNCAIYAGSGGVTINVENNSAFRIYGKNTKGVTGQGIQLDSTANTGIFVTGNSTFLIDGTNRGYVNSPTVYVEDSTFTVQNCTSNASNGGKFTAINSQINFLNNAGHGLSATTLSIEKNSVVTCNGNAYYGVTVGSKVTMDGTSQLTANENGWGYTGGALRLASASTTGTFSAGAKVELNKNVRNALENYGSCTFEDGVELTITNNSEPNNGAGIYNGIEGKLALPANAVVMYNEAGKTGGGICNKGNTTIPASVKLYNNHAGTAGDDIYNDETGTITFGKVGSGWALDGAPDCTDAIDGWYYDGYALDADDNVVSTRWNAHSTPYVHEYTDFTGNVTNAEGTLALKAAHGLETNPDIQPSGPAPDWGNSKSKTATNLDENFESKVTLSLPAASYKGNLDVAFVLDGSTSADQAGLAEQAASLLNKLAEMENLNVKASLTVFGGSVPILEDTGLLDISDATNLTELTNKLTDSSYEGKAGRSGSNLQAGVEAANAKLTADNGVDSADKYLIILSDGAARMWYKNGSAMSQAYNPHDTIFWNSNDDFIYRYGTNAGETGKLPLRSFNDVWTAGQSGAYIGRYGMTEAEKNVADKNMVASWETVAKDPDYYTTYEAATYYAAGSIIKASQNSHVIFVSYPYHSGKTYGTYTESFKAWLASNNYVTRYDGDAMGSASVFDAVKKDLIQVVDAGSKVVDVIGYGDDYDFQFVNDIKALTMTVGGKELAVSEIDDTTYGFGWNGKGYDFVLHYYPNGNGDVSDEHFVWDINVPVTKDETVQLTYTVKLTNPKTTPGTYGSYDADGSKEYGSLYTNNSATLYPVDSNGNEGDPQDFPKPTVSYTVEETSPDPSTEPTDPTPTDPTPDYGKLTIDKSANRTTVRPGKTITYTIKVTNRTGEDLEDIVVSEKLDANLTFVSASGDGNYAVKDGLWTIPELKNGKTAKLTIKATVKSGVKNGTVIKNAVVITEADGDPVPGKPSDSVEVKVSNKVSLIPETGDTSNIGLWIGVLVVCAVALGVALIFFVVKKKKTK